MSQEKASTDQLPLFPEATRALVDREREEIDRRSTPISPDISLPWSGECGPGGWSAKMFLHQMLSTLRPHWTCSDTRELLSHRMPTWLQAKIAYGNSLSDALHPPLKADSYCFLSKTAVRGVLRRNALRQRDIPVLLRIHGDTMRVMVTFGKEGPRCEWPTGQKGNVLADSLKDGLTAFLGEEWRQLQETHVYLNKSTRY